MVSKKKVLPKRNQSGTIKKRQEAQRKEFVEELRKTPIIQYVCQKVGISRSTYYRWLKINRYFAKESGEAHKEGTGLMNDVAQSQLVKLIKSGNLTAIIFWLKSRDPLFTDKRHIRNEIVTKEPHVTFKQAKEITRGLSMVGIMSRPSIEELQKMTEEEWLKTQYPEE